MRDMMSRARIMVVVSHDLEALAAVMPMTWPAATCDRSVELLSRRSNMIAQQLTFE